MSNVFSGWTWLLMAALCEIGWVIGLKHTDGFTRLWPTLFTVPTAIASLVFLSFAVRTLPLGTAYATWTGIGAVGVAIIGIIWFGEPSHLPRLLCIALIVTGLVGLKTMSGS